MRLLFLFLLLASVIFYSVPVQSTNEITPDLLLSYVDTQLEIGYRIPGTAESHEFMRFVANFTEKTDSWQIQFHNFTYDGVELANILITKTSYGSVKIGENNSYFPKILIGAHFDSRAKATKDPLFNDRPVPGANDGGSGVAIILGLMKALDQFNLDIGFVLFDAEDQGYDRDAGIPGWSWIIGSTRFAEALSVSQVNKLENFILLDMVGDKDLQLKRERNSDAELTNEIWNIASEMGYGQFMNTSGYSLIDDHIPFINRGITSVDIIDFDFPYHHTVNDDLSSISGESLFAVYDVVLSWVLSINNLSSSLTDNVSLSSTFSVSSVKRNASLEIFYSLIFVPVFFKKIKRLSKS